MRRSIILGRGAAFLRHARSLPPLAAVILGTLLFFTAFADVISPYDPLQIRLPDRLQPPVGFGGTWAHVLGTDDLGRDLLSRVIHGARISLASAVVSILLGAAVGTAIGLISGYFGGRLDAFLMRVADLAISYPVVLLALLLAVAFGPSMLNVIIVMILVVWARFARIVRGEVLVVREMAYVALARVAGASAVRIMFRHILPNVAPTVLVLASLNTGHVILIEASLSFLGAGVPAPQPAWGSMTALGMPFLLSAWWVSTAPATAILVVVLGFNVFSDWLSDRLDPRRAHL